MLSNNPLNFRAQLFSAALCLLCLILPVNAQQQRTPEQTDDVVRINTELVQTDVMVFDKQGRFVEGLRPEQFELQVNGQPRAVSFFERVTAGSRNEAAQLAAARGGQSASAPMPNPPANTEAPERGRLIFFFLDDLHLSGASMIRAREALQRFVDNNMNAGDQIAIVSTSGQVGFLQQLTDNAVVLNAAIKRLGYRMDPEAYTGKTQISEFAASQILDFGNRELYAYLLESTKIEQQMGPGNRQGDHRVAASYSAAPHLKNRLRQVRSQGRAVTEDTLGALRGLMLSSGSLPGRKLVFFLSDGFIVNERNGGALEMLHSVTEAAARAGAVVYTLDMRGTVFGLGSSVDASTNDYIDLSGRRIGLSFETAATRESLQLIADETGGRAIFNSNTIDDALLQAVRETSSYYLLAWRPEAAEQHDTGARLKVFVKDRPDLRVRLRANSFVTPTAEAKPPAKQAPPVQLKETSATVKTEASKSAPATTSASAGQPQADDAALLSALGSLYPYRALPASLAVGYLDTGNQGPVLKVSMQLERAAFGFDGREQKALVDVMGAAIDDRGQFASFKQLLTITPDSPSEAAPQLVVWHQQLHLKPGLYQVRVAMRDRATGRIGGAQQWVLIPDLSKGAFSLSSLFLGERKAQSAVRFWWT
jgi:VWFA-related protein